MARMDLPRVVLALALVLALVVLALLSSPPEDREAASPNPVDSLRGTQQALRHITAPGEQLTTICRRYYGDESLAHDLAQYNGILQAEELGEGRELQIPDWETLVASRLGRRALTPGPPRVVAVARQAITDGRWEKALDYMQSISKEVTVHGILPVVSGARQVADPKFLHVVARVCRSWYAGKPPCEGAAGGTDPRTSLSATDR